MRDALQIIVWVTTYIAIVCGLIGGFVRFAELVGVM